MFDYFIPLLRYSGETTILSSLLENVESENNRINGYRAQLRESREEIKIAKERLSFNQESLDLFFVFIKECKNYGIELLLVYTPIYIENKKNILNNEEVVVFYQDIAFKNKLKFYDYTQDVICLKKEMFFDAIHLNKKGSELFSRKLAHTLNKARMHNNVYKK